MSGPNPDAPTFRRVIIGFHDAARSPSGIEAAVGFARAMECEILGVFVEDEPLLEWSSSPLARHLTAAAGRPTAVTPELLTAEFATAAAFARLHLARVAEALGVSIGFYVERASAASLEFAGTSNPRDLLIVVEPADPLTRLSYPFAGVVRAIAASSAPVLYLPHRALQRRGPVVAIGQQPDGESLRVAADVAARMGESLISLGGARALSLQDIDRSLAGVAERLVVLGRRDLPSDEPSLFATLAARRLVPTLLVGTGRPGGFEERRPAAQKPSGD